VLGRFIQADSIIPNPGNPQSFDRYAYVLNSPINIIDPTGHKACDGEDVDDCNDVGSGLIHYNFKIFFRGDWNDKDKETVYQAVKDFANRLAEASQGEMTPDEAFNKIFGVVRFEHVMNKCDQGCWGRSQGTNDIRFYVDSTGKLDPRLVIHELGHSLNSALSALKGVDLSPYKVLEKTWSTNQAFPRREDSENGFAGPAFGWQQSTEETVYEEFADMVIGWTYSRWQVDEYSNINEAGLARSNWMDTNMAIWFTQ
jgi:hypothetical protein